jgi:parvulin-like peptidyl-prolyl isomerase
MPAILLTLVVLFLLTIIFEWGMDITGLRSGGIREPLGVVNGREITYQEFSQLLDQEIENYRQRTGSEPSDEVIDRLRDQVWDQLVNRILVEQEIEKLGIKVTDEEIIDWVLNSPETLPEPVKRNFVDSTGQIDRALLQRALQATSPQARQFWIEVEKFLRGQKLTEKLQSRLMSTIRVTEGEIRERFEQQNIKYHIKYISLDPNRFAGKDIEPTEEEMIEYYKAHQDEFRLKERRKLKYVVFSDAPSYEDTMAVMEELNRLKERALEGEDFLELVEEYSEKQFTDVYFKHGELLPDLENAIWDGKKGDIIGPIRASDGLHLVKIIDEREGDEEFVRASHILIRIGRDTSTAYEVANDIIEAIKKGGNFAELARQFSTDPGSAQRGGDLGWFGRGRMVKEFEEACFNARPGDIVGPVLTQFGLHIIKVTGRDNRELKIADIKMSVSASSETIESQRKRAEDFSHIVRGSEFEDEAKALGLKVRLTPPFTKDSPIPGIGTNRAISKWTFESKLGDVSPVFKIKEGFAVFVLSEINEARIRSFDEVKLKSLMAKLSPGDSLDSIVKFDSTLQVMEAKDINLIGTIPRIGRDENLLGKLLNMKSGEIAGPVKGNTYVFLVQLVSKTEFDSTAYKTQRDVIKEQILNEKRSTVFFSWLENLRKKADIEDNRYLYFGY